MARPPLPVLLLLVVGLSASCAETEVAGREMLRLGPYRERTLKPGEIHRAPVPLKAGPDVLDPDEKSELTGVLDRAFAEAVRGYGAGGEPFAGTARLDRCRVRAGFAKTHTVFEAKCRAVLEVGGTPVVEVEGMAVRRIRTRAITKFDKQALTENPRHPSFDFDDAEAALIDAARTAARLLVDPSFRPRRGRSGPGQGQGAEEKPVEPDRAVQRASALRQLHSAPEPATRAAAAVDIARWGRAEDAEHVLPLLEDPSPLVRRAAAMALGELGSPSAIRPLARAAAVDDDEPSRKAAERSRDRLCALFAGQVPAAEPQRETPSNSSTPGALDEGSTPEPSRNRSTWRQNDPCSKR